MRRLSRGIRRKPGPLAVYLGVCWGRGVWSNGGAGGWVKGPGGVYSTESLFAREPLTFGLPFPISIRKLQASTFEITVPGEARPCSFPSLLFSVQSRLGLAPAGRPGQPLGSSCPICEVGRLRQRPSGQSIWRLWCLHRSVEGLAVTLRCYIL